MNDDNSAERRSSSWIRGQLSLANVIAVITIVVGLTAAQKAIEATNQIQDLKIEALTKRLEMAEATSVRRDLYDQRLANIDDKLNGVIIKLDTIGRAVR